MVGSCSCCYCYCCSGDEGEVGGDQGFDREMKRKGEEKGDCIWSWS